MTDIPEKRGLTEPLDIQRNIEDTLAGRRPIESRKYPHFMPDYEIPFLHIGTQKQLFLDNFIIDHLEDVERVFPEPYRPAEPILEVGDLPWERYYNPFPSGAIQDPDDGKFKIWYIQSLSGDPFNTGQVLCYAESTNCIHWEKPLSDKCLPYENYTETNIVEQDTAGVTVVLNHDQSDPDRKFLMLFSRYGFARERGEPLTSTVKASPDGLRWTTVSDYSTYRHHHEPRIIWDESIEKWVAYSQYSHHQNFLHRKRQIGRQESEDFINWSPKEVVLSIDWEPDLPPNLEFHEMSVRRVGGQYIGIPGEFMAEPIWCSRDGANWRDQAFVRLGLYTSRDGKRWVRVGGPGAWVDNRAPGSIDYGYVCYTSTGQLVYDGKLHIPYLAIPDKQEWYSYPPPALMVPEAAYEAGKADWEKLGAVMGGYPRRRRSVGALILREDGWAELKPTYEYGKVYARQFVFEGNRLRINSDCYGGYIRVEILDPDFKPYPGFASEDCVPVCSDDPNRIWHTVQWKADSDLRNLWNKPCRLCFHLHQASLYAFQFVDGQ